MLAGVGERRAISTGDVLFRAGEHGYAFFAVVAGRVAIVDDAGGAGERVVGVHGAGRFLGELSVVSGEPAYLTAIVRDPGEVIALSAEALREIVATDQELGDLILTAWGTYAPARRSVSPRRSAKARWRYSSSTSTSPAPELA